MTALTDKIKGNWNIIKGKILQKYGAVNNDDLIFQEGQEDEIIGRLQTIMGKTKEEVIDWIESLELVS